MNVRAKATSTEYSTLLARVTVLTRNCQQGQYHMLCGKTTTHLPSESAQALCTEWATCEASEPVPLMKASIGPDEYADEICLGKNERRRCKKNYQGKEICNEE